MLVGGALGLVARGNYREQFDTGNCTEDSPPRCNPQGFAEQQSAVTLANVGTGFFVGGGVWAGVGAV